MTDDFLKADYISADERCGRKPARWFPWKPIALALFISLVPAITATIIHLRTFK